MARRRGKPGDYLLSDDITGKTIWGSQARTGYYDEVAKNPFLRNLQEIATGLDDPQPVPLYRGGQYEVTPVCVAATAPIYVGKTSVRTSQNNAAFQTLNLDPGIGDAEIGCSLIVN